MKKRKIQIMGISIFLMTLGMNLQYALNNYGILSLNFNPAILASGSGGSGTEEPNYAYLAKLDGVKCELEKYWVGAGTIFRGIPVNVGFEHIEYGTKMSCELWLVAKCDQNKVTLCTAVVQ